MQGQPTEETVVAEFRARYLYSGNASKVARELGITERTGRKLAERLEVDPSFTEEIRALHAGALRKHITMRLRAAEVASERFEAELEAPVVGGENNTVTIIDKRPDYGRIVLEAEKNAQNLARFEAERGGEVKTDREVTVRFEAIPPK